jgi:hypothetical protein
VAAGDDFRVDEFLKSSTFKPMRVFHKGDIPLKENPLKEQRPDSGFALLVREKLCLNYLFWGVRKGYFEKVQAMMDDAAFPKDAAGGLSTTVPKTLTPLAEDGK